MASSTPWIRLYRAYCGRGERLSKFVAAHAERLVLRLRRRRCRHLGSDVVAARRGLRRLRAGNLLIEQPPHAALRIGVALQRQCAEIGRTIGRRRERRLGVGVGRTALRRLLDRHRRQARGRRQLHCGGWICQHRFAGKWGARSLRAGDLLDHHGFGRDRLGRRGQQRAAHVAQPTGHTIHQLLQLHGGVAQALALRLEVVLEVVDVAEQEVAPRQ